MIATPKQADELDDEDLGEDLPPLPGALDEEEEDFRPDDDADLDLDLDLDDSEELGLDVETGLEDPGEPELGEADDGEGVRWTEGAEADENLEGAEADLIEGAEYGWTGDDEPAGGDDWGEDLGFEETGPSLVDSGEEGLEEDDLERDIGELPPLVRAPGDGPDHDEEATVDQEAFDLALLGELSEGSLEREEALVTVGEGAQWPAMAPEHVQVEPLMALRDETLLAGSDGQALLLHQGRLWRAGTGGEAEQRGAIAGTPASLFLAGNNVALGVSGAVLASRDGGRSVERHALPKGLPAVPVHAAWTRGEHEPRLWAAPVDGPLLRSDRDGEPLSIVEPDARVLQLTSDGHGALARVLRGPAGRPVVERSTDDGSSWEAWRAPAETPEALCGLAVVRELVVVARSAPTEGVLYAREEGPWLEALAGGRAPATLVDEDHDAVLYTCVASAEGTFIVRRPLSDRGRTPKVVVELPLSRYGRALHIAGGHVEGTLVLWVATERAWLRIRARLDTGAG